MQHVNVTGPAFQPTMQSVDNHERDLRDEVALAAFKEFLDGEQVMKDICNGMPTETIAKAVAAVSYDFVDAFMRERYERECVARAMMKVNIPLVPKGIEP